MAKMIKEESVNQEAISMIRVLFHKILMTLQELKIITLMKAEII